MTGCRDGVVRRIGVGVRRCGRVVAGYRLVAAAPRCHPCCASALRPAVYSGLSAELTSNELKPIVTKSASALHPAPNAAARAPLTPPPPPPQYAATAATMRPAQAREALAGAEGLAGRLGAAAGTRDPSSECGPAVVGHHARRRRLEHHHMIAAKAARASRGRPGEGTRVLAVPHEAYTRDGLPSRPFSAVACVHSRGFSGVRARLGRLAWSRAQRGPMLHPSRPSSASQPPDRIRVLRSLSVPVHLKPGPGSGQPGPTEGGLGGGRGASGLQVTWTAVTDPSGGPDPGATRDTRREYRYAVEVQCCCMKRIPYILS